MKKLLQRIKDGLTTTFLTLAAVLFIIVFIIFLPFTLIEDYIKYKRSLYYKCTRNKYHFLAASGMQFDVFNIIAKEKLPIRFVSHPKEPSVEQGWFLLADTLIIVNAFPFSFDPETQQWNYCDEEHRTLLSLEEYFETTIQEVNTLTGKQLCSHAVVLIDRDDLEDLAMAEKEPRFVIFDGDRAAALKKFCAQSL